MIQTAIAVAMNPAARALAIKLGSAFLFAFAATAGSIAASKLFRENGPRKWPSWRKP